MCEAIANKSEKWKIFLGKIGACTGTDKSVPYKHHRTTP